MRKLRRHGEKGFALVELLVSTGIMALTAPLLGAGIYATVFIAGSASDDMKAVADVRAPVQWLSQDLHMAATTTLVDGAAASSSATFSWTDKFNGGSVPHSVAYALSDGQLLRTYDGLVTPIGRRVSAVAFSRIGSLITVTVTSASEGRHASTQQQAVKALMRVNG